MKARHAVLAGATVLLVLGFTAWALESGGVAVVETQAGDGALRSTHVWFVEQEGALWVEAGTPQNGWFLDVLDRAELRIEINGQSREVLARPDRDPARRRWLRTQLRAKYGLRDLWVGLFVDGEASVPVRLEPRPGAAPDTPAS